MFQLDSRLKQDTIFVTDFRLSRLLLMNDRRYPWFILVPRRSDISEVFQLDDDDRDQLWREATLLAEGLKDTFGADKMNIATLGNMVAQLHVHVIARKNTDDAWPGPVWGAHAALPYTTEEAEQVVARLKLVLTGDFRFEGAGR
jgi:diadenosine tetraphosphate (Ap4A) HIT family hydrolase